MLSVNDIAHKVHMGSNFSYFILKAFLVSCEGRCFVCTNAGAVCPENIFSWERVIHCPEHITHGALLWKRQAGYELFLDVVFWRKKYPTNRSTWTNSATSVDSSIWRAGSGLQLLFYIFWHWFNDLHCCIIRDKYCLMSFAILFTVHNFHDCWKQQRFSDEWGYLYLGMKYITTKDTRRSFVDVVTAVGLFMQF